MKEENVAKILKKIRESKNLTQDEVASKLSLGRNSIVRIESGKRKVSASELSQFEKLYNIDLEDYVGTSKNKRLKALSWLVALVRDFTL